MPTFVLIHGSFCQGSIWAETAAALRDDGHRAEAVDLPSSGTAAAQLGDLRADTDAVRRALDRTGAGAVLVAHSGGGMVLTEFADHPSVQHSVYLAAFWPRKGQSIADITGGQVPAWMVARDDGTFQVSGDPEAVRQALCADIDAERFAADVYPRYVLTSVSSMTAPSTAPQPTHPATYIICEQDQVIPPQAQEAMSAAADHVVRLASPHAAMLSMPRQLASALGGVLTST
jgi:pimeloyl-ACP methyl ester carboxylesterase